MIVNPRGRKDALPDRTPIGSANFHGAVGVASEDDIHGQSKGDSHLVKVIPDDGLGSDMENPPMTPDQMTCYAINTYGSGMHPYAEPHNLDPFVASYVVECLVALRDDMMEDTSGQLQALIIRYQVKEESK